MSSSNIRNALGAKASRGGEANSGSKGGRSVAAPAPDKNNGRATPAKQGRPRERPVSKFEDLRMHGYKPWDPNANEFYDALVKARIELDKELDAMDAMDAKDAR